MLINEKFSSIWKSNTSRYNMTGLVIRLHLHLEQPPQKKEKACSTFEKKKKNRPFNIFTATKVNEALGEQLYRLSCAVPKPGEFTDLPLTEVWDVGLTAWGGAALLAL